MGVVITVGAWVWFKISAKSSLPMKQISTPSFPLGSLGSWDHLLRLNHTLLDEKRAIVSQWIFHTEAFAVISGENVQRVLRASTSRDVRPAFVGWLGMFHIRRFMGPHSVGIAEGEPWARYRKAIGASLKPSYLRTLLVKMEACVQQVKAHFEAQIAEAGGVVDCAPCFHALTLDVLGCTIFNTQLGALESMRQGKEDEVLGAFRYASDEMARRMSSVNPLDWMYFLGGYRERHSARRL